jgi:hypothetical protein
VAKQYVVLLLLLLLRLLLLLLLLLWVALSLVESPLPLPHGTSDTPDNGAAHSLLAVLAESWCHKICGVSIFMFLQNDECKRAARHAITR